MKLQHACAFRQYTRIFVQSGWKNIPGNEFSCDNTQNLFLPCNGIGGGQRKQSKHTAHSQTSPLFGSHKQGVSHRPANTLICFSACQRRLKRAEVHNTEQNEQVVEDTAEEST